MNDDRSTSDDFDATALGETDGEPTDGGPLDAHDDAVIAADDTGMLAGERLITLVEIEEGLEGK